MEDAVAAVGVAWEIGKDLYGTPGHLTINKPEDHASTYLNPDDPSIPVEVVGNYIAYITYVRRSCLTKMHMPRMRDGEVRYPTKRRAKLRAELALYYQLVKVGDKNPHRHRPVHIRHCHLEVADGKRRNLFGEAAMVNFTIDCCDSDKGPFLLWSWEATTEGRSVVSFGTENAGTFELHTDNTLTLGKGDSEKFFSYRIEQDVFGSTMVKGRSKSKGTHGPANRVIATGGHGMDGIRDSRSS